MSDVIRTSNERISPPMVTALTALADYQEHSAKQPFPAWNTVVALESRGLVVQQATKYGLLLTVTVKGFHALGRKHPYEPTASETLAAPRVYTHVKTGNQYEVLHDATETTNGSREGRGVVVYRRIGQTAVYVREATEFHEKFVSSGKPDAQNGSEQA